MAQTTTLSGATARGGLSIVLASAGAVTLLDLATSAVVGQGIPQAMVAAVTLGLLTVAFWAGSARLIARLARTMEHSGTEGELARASANAYPVLAGFALLDLIQALLAHGGFTGVAGAVGWLAVPLLVVFIGLTVLAVERVHRAPFFTAFSLALLPYALVSAALLLLGVVASVVLRLS